MQRLRLPIEYSTDHPTAGLPGFPARDFFAPADTLVEVNQPGEITGVHFIEWSFDRRVGGWTVYFQGDNGDTYYGAHGSAWLPSGARVVAGQVIGQVSAVPFEWWESHIHWGHHRGRFYYSGSVEIPPPIKFPVSPERMAVLRAWILAKHAAGWTWKQIKKTANWREWIRGGGK